MKLTAVTRSMRLPFLILTLACVFLGVSIVLSTQKEVSLLLLLLALAGALLAHISVNTLNEYFDFKSGLDLITTKTPFSGGSGSLPQHPELKSHIFIVGTVSLALSTLIGCFFLWKYGISFLPIGLIGAILIVTYTQFINKLPITCLITPGLGFGILMVVGTQFVLEGEYLLKAFFIGIIPFLLANNLLLLNQYPDIQADTKVGRNHFPIAYGVNRSNLIYGLFTLATTFIILIYILIGYLPTLSWIALIPMPLAFFSLYGAIKHKETIGSFPHYLGANVAVAVLTPLLLGLSILF
ncbi:MAG: prenyltransferase [Cycloclasticus sp.]|nr:prenyltransferase [Cycloclasticus sp.]